MWIKRLFKRGSVTNCVLFRVTIVAGIFGLFGCSKKDEPYDAADVYSQLRTAALNSNPQTIGLEVVEGSPGVWGLIMETGHPEAVVSLVAMTGGNVSVYISNGGGVFGTGSFPDVSSVADELIAMAPKHMSSLAKSTSHPLPRRGFVRFYILSGHGVFTAEVKDKTLAKGTHSLSPLYYKGHEVITKVGEVQRRATEQAAPADAPGGPSDR